MHRGFVDSWLRRSPPNRVAAVPYGQAMENASRFPPLAHRSAAAHKLHSAYHYPFKIRERQNHLPTTGLSLFHPGDCPRDRSHRALSCLHFLHVDLIAINSAGVVFARTVVSANGANFSGARPYITPRIRPSTPATPRSGGDKSGLSAAYKQPSRSASSSHVAIRSRHGFTSWRSGLAGFS